MKKLITLIIVASLALTIQAQDITNTLSATGNFKVNKNDGTTNLFTLSETDDHIMQLSTNKSAFTLKNGAGQAAFEFDDFADITNLAMIRIGHADENWHSGNFAHLQFQSESNTYGNTFKLIGRRANNVIAGYYGLGTGSVPKDVEDGNFLLTINGYGYNNSYDRLAASMAFVVDGTPQSDKNHVPGKITFETGTATAVPVIRMTIKSDGTVNISGLPATTGGGASGDKPVYVNSSGDLVAGTAVAAPQLNNQIQQLKEENLALQAEMAELRKMVEGLMQEK